MRVAAVAASQRLQTDNYPPEVYVEHTYRKSWADRQSFSIYFICKQPQAVRAQGAGSRAHHPEPECGMRGVRGRGLDVRGVRGQGVRCEGCEGAGG